MTALVLFTFGLGFVVLACVHEIRVLNRTVVALSARIARLEQDGPLLGRSPYDA